MIYREAAKPDIDVLETIDLWLPKHHVTTALLVIFGCLFFIPLLSMLMSVGEFELWMSWFPGIGGTMILIAIVLRAWRRRPMRIVREGELVKLSIDRGLSLTLPIELSGTQLVVRSRNAENWRLFLRLRAEDGHAILLEEGRGLAHGKQESWLYGLPDDPKARPDYMVKPNTLAKIRAKIEHLNKELRT